MSNFLSFTQWVRVLSESSVYCISVYRNSKIATCEFGLNGYKIFLLLSTFGS
jgi:hypothetical protein